MIEKITDDVWRKFLNLLPSSMSSQDPAIPRGLMVQGSIDVKSWVPNEKFLTSVKYWMISQNEDFVYYFLLDGAEEDYADFKINISHLTESNLEELNFGFKSALTNVDFSWVISSDGDKEFHVAGPRELFLLLK